jgi:hypothetical protein
MSNVQQHRPELSLRNAQVVTDSATGNVGGNQRFHPALQRDIQGSKILKGKKDEGKERKA